VAFAKWERKAATQATYSLNASYSEINAELGDDEMGADVVDDRVESPLDRPQSDDVRRFLMKWLSPREWSVIDKYYYDSKTLREIGTLIGCSEANVLLIRDRALNRLRDLKHLVVPAMAPV
jgi:RNA polymerase sigma factor (sigma-70 family)